MRIGSLCTGYGGLDMAVEAYYNAETVWTCEFDKYACQVIEKRINKPNHGNLKTTNWSNVEPIDILTAGYPCQPFSHAGLRKGVEDERHLWPYIKEIIGLLRPQFVILENVRGHFGLGFREVLSDLTSIGYDARWTLVRASDVGAPHRRERLFILAEPSNPNSKRGIIRKSATQGNQGQPQFKSGRGSKIVANPNHARRFGDAQESPRRFDTCSTSNPNWNEQPGNRQTQKLGRRFNTRAEMRLQKPPNPLDINFKLNPKFVEYMMGLPEGWVTDVDISRAQMLKILGNGVVPQQAYRALEILNA